MSTIYAGKRVLRTSSGASMAPVGPEWLFGFHFKTWAPVDVVVTDYEDEKVADELTIRLAEFAKVIVSSKSRRLMKPEAKIGLSRYDFVRHQAVLRYLKLIQKGVKRMKASQMCSEAFFSRSTSNGHVCRSVRVLVTELLLKGSLPRSRQGRHEKTPLLFSKKIVYSRPSNYGFKDYCVDLSGPPLDLNAYSLAPAPTRR
jgi:hypothetical protein